MKNKIEHLIDLWNFENSQQVKLLQLTNEYMDVQADADPEVFERLKNHLEKSLAASFDFAVIHPERKVGRFKIKEDHLKRALRVLTEYGEGVPARSHESDCECGAHNGAEHGQE